MFILMLLVLGLSMPMVAQSQVACFNYGSIVSCDSTSGNTTIAPLSRNQGVITQRNSRGSSMEPYTIIGGGSAQHRAIEPLPQLERLPSSSSNDDGYRSSRQVPIYGGSTRNDPMNSFSSRGLLNDPLGLDR